MREEMLWQLAEALLPLRDELHAMRGEVGEMRAAIHDAQQKTRTLRDEVLAAGRQTGTDKLRNELRRARGELRAFQNELRCMRAFSIRQKNSLGRIADEMARTLL